MKPKRLNQNKKALPRPEWECSHSGNIFKQPMFDISSDLCLQNVCYICGRICPAPVVDCDAAISIDRIEHQLGQFAKKATSIEIVAFADYVCKVLKNIIKTISDEYLEGVLTNEDCSGLKYMLVAEASRRREEIDDWITYITPDLIAIAELSPKNFTRSIPVQMVRIVSGVEDKDANLQK